MTEQKGRTGRTITVVLCGSMRYFPLMLRVAQEETAAGRIVLMPYEAVPEGEQNDAHKAMLDELHRHKIRVSSRIVVVSDETGYYGTSTKGEIEYAKSLGIPVEYRRVVSNADGDDEIERASEAAWSAYWNPREAPWAEQSRAIQDTWRVAIRAALAALKEGQRA